MRPLLLSFLLFFQLSAFTQSSPVQTLSGTVREEEAGPLESATVSLFRFKDSTVLSSSRTSAKGSYSFSALQPGVYYLQVTAIGHSPFDGKPFTIKEGGPAIVVPAINLSRSASALATVAVVSRKSFIEQKADRMIVNVDASPTNAGSTAMDVLEKSPGVTVDKDGNISLKGKQDVVVMIDDKPTYMTSTQLASYLKGLPASVIDKLEIMTNPSAKYDAAGNAGIN